MSRGGEGVEHVLEVGGEGTMTQSLRAIRMEGVISVIGLLTGAQPKDNIMETLSRVCTVRGVYVGSREQLEEMVKFMEEHEIHPVMDKTVFTLDTVKEAYEYMVSALLVGSAEGNADKQTVGAEALWQARYHDRVVCWIGVEYGDAGMRG